jgi:hypothetical protein
VVSTSSPKFTFQIRTSFWPSILSTISNYASGRPSDLEIEIEIDEWIKTGNTCHYEASFASGKELNRCLNILYKVGLSFVTQ